MNWKSLLFSAAMVGASTLFAEKVDLDDKLEKADSWSMKKGWEKSGEEFVSQSGNFLILKDKVGMKSGKFEAEVTPIKATGTSWKVAGILIYISGDQYWQLALVEKPDNLEKDAKGHFVELKCKKGKIWGAERDQKRLKYKGFKWDYNKTYKLKIKFTPERIDGTIEGDDDKVLAHMAFELNADAVKGGSPALRSNGFEAKFKDLEAEVEK